MTPETPPTPPSDRDQAHQLLDSWCREGQIPQESALWQEVSGFTRELVWTCIRHKGELDAWIDHLSARPPGRHLRGYLWMGLAQIFYLCGIPDHAAVHETLETAKRSRLPKSQLGFLNALLRRSIREQSGLRDWMATQPPDVRYSHPAEVIDRWSRAFGQATAFHICEWNQKRSCTLARLTRTGQQPGVQNRVSADVAPHPDFPDFFVLPRKMAPFHLPDFDQGAWYIQDPSTSVAPALLDAKPGERILDGCAAPGGKTLILAEALQGSDGSLMAIDPNPARMHRLVENLTRLQHPEVETRTAEPADLADSHAGAFDAVLLDVPCTNTGVYQRRPDAKWAFTEAGLHELTRLQRKLLSDGAALVAPGGRMVYSTCSIEPEETREQIAAWLADNPGWIQAEDVLLLPGERHCDGAYACRLERR